MLKNLPVLIVEDEFLIAELLGDMLSDLECGPVSVATDVSGAIEALAKNKPGLALLDLNLAGKSSLPVADILRSKQIPFVISSGYDPSSLSEEWRKYPLLSKPYTADELAAKISQALAMHTL